MTTNTTPTVGRDFILAGDAIFTLVGRTSRFTYHVTRVEPEAPYTTPAYFVSVLTGKDNTKDYTYMGLLNPETGTVRPTKKSHIATDAPSFVAINWALPKIFSGVKLPPAFAIHHEGYCGRCGRKLTVPSSIVTGIGPDCAKLMGIVQVDAEPKGKAKKAAPKQAKFDLAAFEQSELPK